ncbi:MAG: hypothetical protein M5U31_03045 [Acidimicrobiia bacterium]|nr:hypothetical protein [Acidimicrobiia bacterium]
MPSDGMLATRSEPTCAEVAALLPDAIDTAEPFDFAVRRHVESCLCCQAEVARYRVMLRGLHELRTRYLEPAPGLLAGTLAALEAEGERRALRSVLTGRRLAYAGAIGGTLAAAGAAATAVMIARSRRGHQLAS